MNPDFSFSENDGTQQEITWDFRQFYVRYVSMGFQEYKIAKIGKNYNQMLLVLDDLHSLIYGRVKKKWDDKDDTFIKLRNELLQVANKHEPVFIGKSSTPKGISEINEAFNRVIEYLVYTIKKNQLFGITRSPAGL